MIRKLGDKFFILAFCFIISCTLFANECEYAREINASFIQQIEEEFNIACCSYLLPNDTERFSIYFKVYQRATLEEARAWVILLTDKFMQHINSNEKIRPYLKEYPFPANHVEINIEFYNLANTPYCDDINISKVTHIGKLYYETERVFSNVNNEIHAETYDEAEKIVSETDATYKHQNTEFETATDILLCAFSGCMYKKYRCTCEKIAAQTTPDHLEKIEAIFTVFQRCKQKKAREAQVYATETLLKLINENEIFHPYLKKHPFTAENLKIRLNFRKYERWGIGWPSYSDGSIGAVTLEDNQLTYTRAISTPSVYDPEAFVGIESYDKAFNIATKPSKLAFWKNLFGLSSTKS